MPRCCGTTNVVVPGDGATTVCRSLPPSKSVVEPRLNHQPTNWTSGTTSVNSTLADTSSIPSGMTNATESNGSGPPTRPEACDQTWLEAGMREQRRSGLARALFCVRLLEQGSDGSAEQRLSFLIGVFLASDVDAMVSRGLFNSEGTVVITGGGVIAEAFSGALARLSARTVILDDDDVERALLAGCRSVFSVLGAVPRA